MKKWIGLGLLMMFAIALTIAWGWYINQKPAQVTQIETTAKVEQRSRGQQWNDTAAEASVLTIDAPIIDSNKLLEHIKALDFERYREGDRLRAREYIWDVLTKAGWTPQLQEFDRGVNVWAKREGSDPAAGAILVGAHYDTVPGSPGADDNATGVATVLEIARLLGLRQTARGLWVAFFDEEELGLLGSLAFTGDEIPLDEVKGAIVLDMIGYACHSPGCQQYPKGLPVKPPSDKGEFIAVVGDIEHRPLLNVFEQLGKDNSKSASNSLPAAYTLPVFMKGVWMPDVMRSDHAPFWLKGIGAVLVTDTANLRSPHYHEPSDRPNTLDRDFFVGSAQLVVNATTALLESKGSLASAK